MKVKDSIEHILDNLSDIREELLSLERAIERISSAFAKRHEAYQ
jgi:archaellum component FlaC